MGQSLSLESIHARTNDTYSHIHVSLKDKDGDNIFAATKEHLKNGRPDAQYDDTKFMSKEAEWFLAGVLDGLPDGEFQNLDHQKVR